MHPYKLENIGMILYNWEMKQEKRNERGKTAKQME